VKDELKLRKKLREIDTLAAKPRGTLDAAQQKKVEQKAEILQQLGLVAAQIKDLEEEVKRVSAPVKASLVSAKPKPATPTPTPKKKAAAEPAMNPLPRTKFQAKSLITWNSAGSASRGAGFSNS
jgi:FAD/FMN-containing dehydrogenase